MTVEPYDVAALIGLRRAPAPVKGPAEAREGYESHEGTTRESSESE